MTQRQFQHHDYLFKIEVSERSEQHFTVDVFSKPSDQSKASPSSIAQYNFDKQSLQSGIVCLLDSQVFNLVWVYDKPDHSCFQINQDYYYVRIFDPKNLDLSAGGQSQGDAKTQLNANMPGKVVKILVKDGQAFKTGDSLIILEAMKMENELKAEFDGQIKQVKVKAGQSIESGEILLEFEV